MSEEVEFNFVVTVPVAFTFTALVSEAEASEALECGCTGNIEWEPFVRMGAHIDSDPFRHMRDAEFVDFDEAALKAIRKSFG